MTRAVRDSLGTLARALPATLLVLFAVELSCLWCVHQGFTLSSADDATRLLIADAFGRHGVWPIHWTWPPLPMAFDALLVAGGGDLLPRAVALRAAMMAATAFLLAHFWTRAFPERVRLPGSSLWIAALWLFFPIDVRLALSGLSEPYLYLLLVIGLCCWQRGESSPAGARRARAAWLCGAGLAFGLSTWCRYEGGLFAVLLAMRCGGRAASRLWSGGSRCRRSAAMELAPALLMVPFPLVWLGLQAWAFGDPFTFLHATRAAIRTEALALYGSETMPVRLVVDALGHLWGAPLLVAAAAGLVRLAIERRATCAAILVLVALYLGMAAVSFGGRTDFYLNLFSLGVIPLAVKGAESALWVCGAAWARIAGRRRRIALPVGGALLATGALCQIAFADVPAVLASPFGAWLTPGHRELFLRLRRLSEGERALVVLDPTRMAEVDHPWDNIALVLAAPERVVVVPFEEVIAPRRLSRLPWLASADFQKALAQAPERTAAALSPHDFTRVFRDQVGSLDAFAVGLHAAGYRPVEGCDRAIEYVGSAAAGVCGSG